MAGSRTVSLLAALLICLTLTVGAAGCSFTENSGGDCNALGGNNSVNCTGVGNGAAGPAAPQTSALVPAPTDQGPGVQPASAAPTSAAAQAYTPPLATGSASITGEWTVTYAAPATVTITLAGGTYAEKAVTRVLVPNSSCYLPPGTLLSTFTQTGPGTYAGQQNTYLSNCAFDYSTSVTLTLSSDRNTLIAHFGHAIPPTVIFTRI